MSSEKDVAKTMIFHIKMMMPAPHNTGDVDLTRLLRTLIRLGYSRDDYLCGWQFMFENRWAVRHDSGFTLTDVGRLQAP